MLFGDVKTGKIGSFCVTGRYNIAIFSECKNLRRCFCQTEQDLRPLFPQMLEVCVVITYITEFVLIRECRDTISRVLRSLTIRRRLLLVVHNVSLVLFQAQTIPVLLAVVCCLLRLTWSAPTTFNPSTTTFNPSTTTTNPSTTTANPSTTTANPSTADGDVFYHNPSDAPPAGHDIEASGVAPFLNHLYRETSCPTELPTSGDQEQRATCPWYYVINHDEDRFPADIAEARCRCERCVNGQSGNQCERVYYNHRVLRRVGETEGMYRWVPAWEKISTGCTCTVPITLPASSPAGPEPVID